MQKERAGHPAMRLIPHWKTARGTPADEASEQKLQLNLKMTKTYTIALIVKHVKLVNEESFEKIWTSLGDDK